MDYERFYKQLFQPIEEGIGRFDKATIMAIIGFDCGGPVSLSTVGREHRKKFVTYVTVRTRLPKGTAASELWTLRVHDDLRRARMGTMGVLEHFFFLSPS